MHIGECMHCVSLCAVPSRSQGRKVAINDGSQLGGAAPGGTQVGRREAGTHQHLHHRTHNAQLTPQ